MEYKFKPYTGEHIDYKPTNPAAKMDTKIKFYEPQNPIKDIPKTRTYDTKPPKNIRTKTYDTPYTPYQSYAEYVPPWSRGKVKGKRKVKGQGQKKLEEKKEEKQKVTFALRATEMEDEKPTALGSVKRMLMLFG